MRCFNINFLEKDLLFHPMRYYPATKPVRTTETVASSNSWVETVKSELGHAKKWKSSFGQAYESGMQWESTPHVHMGVHSDAYRLDSIKMARHCLREWTTNNLPWAGPSLFAPPPPSDHSDMTLSVPSDTISLQHFIRPRDSRGVTRGDCSSRPGKQRQASQDNFTHALNALRERRTYTASAPLKPSKRQVAEYYSSPRVNTTFDLSKPRQWVTRSRNAWLGVERNKTNDVTKWRLGAENYYNK